MHYLANGLFQAVLTLLKPAILPFLGLLLMEPNLRYGTSLKLDSV